MKGSTALFVLVCALLLTAAGSAIAQPQAFIEPREPQVYDTITFSIRHGGTLEAPSAMPRASDNLNPIQGIQRQSSFNTISGRTETLSWQYDAMEAGEFSIGPVDVMADGRRVTIPPITGMIKAPPPPSALLPSEIQELAGNPNPLASGDRGLARFLSGKAFVLIDVPDDLIVGWPFHVNTYVLVSNSLTGAEERSFAPSNVSGQQFVTVPELSTPHGNINARQIQIGGEMFRQYHVHTTTLVPTRPGRAELRSGEMRVDFLTMGRTLSRLLTSVVFEPAKKSVDIRPLPPQLPGAHLQVVGNHSITSSLDRKVVTQGELLTLTIRVSGNGYLDLTSLEAMPEIDGLTFIREEISSRISTTHRNEYAASRTFTRTYQATGSGDVIIPPIVMANYNPLTDTQEIRKTEELRLVVEAATGATQVLGSSGAQQPAQADARDLGAGGILHIDTRPLEPRRKGSVLASSILISPWYWLLHTVLFCGVAVVAILLVHRRTTAASPEQATRNKSRGNNSLRRAERADAENDTSGFYSAIAEVLMSHVGRILDRESGAMTIEDAVRGLRQRGVAEPLVKDASDLLERCQSIPYLPSIESVDRAQDLQTTRRLTRELGKIRG